MIQSKVVTIAGKSGISPRTIREIPGKNYWDVGRDILWT